MLPYVVGSIALVLLVAEMTGAFGARARLPLRVTGWTAFMFVSVLSIYVASRAPHGRKPFAIGFSVAPDDLAWSMTKVAHLRSIAVIFLLAVLALGTERLLAAFGLTMLVGIGWELAETTVVGHYARVADLAPNIVSGTVSLAVIAGIRWILKRRQVRQAADALHESLPT